jgi:metallo-beta-lactamase family protein
VSTRPRLTFFGAAGEVTGSCTLLETDRARVLIDLGMIQGDPDDEARNRDLPPFDADRLDAVILTHAHIDHCGRVPMLAPTGFDGPIFATQPTAELLSPVLHGSARLQVVRMYEHVTEQRLRGGRGAGVKMRRRSADEPFGANLPDLSDDPTAPIRLYSTEDVDEVLDMVEPVGYGTPFEPAPGISARFLDAGHVIGSASIELTIAGKGGSSTRLVLSGDIGAAGSPLLPPPSPPDFADVVVMESTYGGRSHPDASASLVGLAEILAEAARSRDKLVIPTFSLGRAQQLLFALGELSRTRRLAGIGVYLDSKMAIAASEVYARHPDLLRDGPARMIRAGKSPLQFPELHYITDRDDSRRLNTLREGGVIVAGAGFCHGGPVVHHLMHTLWREDARVLFIGHQPEGTPAYEIASGARTVEIRGREVEINCRVHRLTGFSGHADHAGLVDWIGSFRGTPGAVLLNHGDNAARTRLAQAIGPVARTPEPGDTVEL